MSQLRIGRFLNHMSMGRFGVIGFIDAFCIEQESRGNHGANPK
jgi:hypothetical protein